MIHYKILVIHWYVVILWSRYPINIINKTTRKLNSIIKTGKDKLDKYDKAGILYEIGCKGCDSVYIGQSKRKLKVRVGEHRRDVKNSDTRSALANHVRDTKHKINFRNVRILDQVQFHKTRLFQRC